MHVRFCVNQSAMAMCSEFHRFNARQALSVLSVLAVLANHVQGRNYRDDCPSFSCGPLGSISSPFHQDGDPPGCGSQSYKLFCSDTKARIRIDNATYGVSAINYSDSTFWVVDADFDLHNDCPLPRWKRPRYAYQYNLQDSHGSTEVELEPEANNQANFVQCSQEVKGNGIYMPADCLSTSHSFVYVLTGPRSYQIENLEPSCRYLAMTPLGNRDNAVLENASYADVKNIMMHGFAVQFPFPFRPPRSPGFKKCLMESIPAFPEEPRNSAAIEDWVLNTLQIDATFLICALDGVPMAYRICLQGLEAIWKFIAVLCRFVLAPLAVLIFLGHKYLKTRITIDAVEKFLRMQQMLGPTRYAYTDIIAITNHFRDKLGQGGYGSVFKGVFLPGDVHVAVKMLDGTANCDGEDFISEVSTIGRIHHINVVRLVGFCSEEMRRALVYEYMPRGSLDKYIFKSFSWDKLNDIALGVARAINYLHQGCEMQILHFHIKPHNILFDNNFVPKVADFGLAKLYPRGNNFVRLSALRGTIGYIAPEMISRSFGLISSKSDVLYLMLQISVHSHLQKSSCSHRWQRNGAGHQ